MDKRWILIIIILVIGVGSLYTIVNDSTSVGKSFASVDNVMVVIPQGFTNFQTHGNTVTIENKYATEKLYFESIEEGNHSKRAFENKTSSLKELNDVEIVKNVSKNISGITTYLIYYKHIGEAGNTTEYIAGYFDKFNCTYGVIAWNFNNTERGEDNIKFVVETIYPDYKKPKN